MQVEDEKEREDDSKVLDELCTELNRLPDEGDEVTVVYDSNYSGDIEVTGEVLADPTVKRDGHPVFEVVMNDPRRAVRKIAVRITPTDAAVQTYTGSGVRPRQVGTPITISVESDDTETLIEDDFSRLSTDDYPDDPPSAKVDFTKSTPDGELAVELTYRDGRIIVSATGAYNFQTQGTLDYRDGEPIVACGSVWLNGTRRSLDLTIPEAVHEELQGLEEAYAAWQQAATRWLLRQPLRFRVENHEYTTGWRTKYHHEAVVLTSNKRERAMTPHQRRLLEALKEEWGTADGYPEVDEESEYEVGDVVSAGDLATGAVLARVEQVWAEEREQERWEHLADEHPDLRGIQRRPMMWKRRSRRPSPRASARESRRGRSGAASLPTNATSTM